MKTDLQMQDINTIDLFDEWKCSNTRKGVSFLLSQSKLRWLKDFKNDLKKKPTEKQIEKGMTFLMQRIGHVERVIDCEGFIHRSKSIW